MNKKCVYSFGRGAAEGSAKMKDVLGGKGANLAEMSNLGLLVPPGFTISTEVCVLYYKKNKTIAPEFTEQILAALAQVEKSLGKNFGDVNNPLLVSVRSGARVSMPGMMDTILNLGLNDKTVLGLAKISNNKRFAYDSYRRFIQMYSDVVLGVDIYHFEEALEEKRREKNVRFDYELSAEDLDSLIAEYKKIVEEKSKKPFPQDVKEQLWGAIRAVFDSWMCARAISYRKMYGISDEWGTAVNIQSMVFGNMGPDSGSGVIFTRNPSTGEKALYGEYLVNCQGEDVVAGIRTPYPITNKTKAETGSSDDSMEESWPEMFKELKAQCENLELHYRDMQDIEFTIEKGVLWMLQTRSGKRTVKSALKIAVDLVKEGLINDAEAIQRIDAESLHQLLHPTLDPKAKKHVFAKGLPASPGAASGVVVFSAQEAERLSKLGEKVLLVRAETSPEDINGMYVAQGILTSRGGMTSHAAVVARGMGKPCIVGASSINIDYDAQMMKVGDTSISVNQYITINGETGEVMIGKVDTIDPVISEDFKTVMEWADKYRQIKIRANAETVHDIKAALNFNAEGVGLCRTEHMFFEGNRIISVRKMIVAENAEDRKAALAEILPMQRKDFIDIFSLMKDKPVNIRLLDMPLHEFLPKDENEIAEVAKALNVDFYTVNSRCKQLHESNPMLGHRGSRLGITYPEIYVMQVRAILEAAIAVKEHGINVSMEIMVPLIATAGEMMLLRDLIEDTARDIEIEYSTALYYEIGTMIELPRAALCSDKIAHHAAYMSYGTNDLSQTTFGLSRDDSASFIQEYIDRGIFSADPFVELDIEGVGELIKISAERARKTNPNIKLGICGEHGGHPRSIAFFDSLDFTYVSCSPYRIQIARLAAAQAAIKNGKWIMNGLNLD